MRNDMSIRVRPPHGTTAFTTSIPWLATPHNEVLPVTTPQYEFAIVPLPAGPSNNTGNTGAEAWSDGLMFTQSPSWTPADLLVVMEEFFSWAGQKTDLFNDHHMYWGQTGIVLCNVH